MAHGMTAVREDPFARLDAWVLEELEALTGPRPRPVERERRRSEPDAPTFEVAPTDAPLALEEAHFVQQVTDWLSGRPNADLILEEIWRNVLPADGPEDAGEEDPGAADGAEEAFHGADMAAANEAEAPEGPSEVLPDLATDEPSDDPPQA